MNKDVFLNCLAYTGVDTGTSVLGLYSFLSGSGLQDSRFNLIYSTGYNYYNGLPYNKALPLIDLNISNRSLGDVIFQNDVPFYINKNSGNFGILFSLNYSGCLHVENNNYVLFSSTSGLSENNSGILLGITPTNRLFLNVADYFSSIPKDISENDFAYISVEENRFVNFGLFSLKENLFYRKSFDNENNNLIIQNLYIGGTLNYKKNYSGYKGIIKELYLFNGNLIDPFLNYCVDCSYATGYRYNQFLTPYTGIKITGSYWTGIKEIQVTGYDRVTGSHPRIGGSPRSFYYDSGKTGEVQIYESLIPEIGLIPYQLTGSGINFYFDTGKRFSQTTFNAFFDLGLYSGDIIEIYTYPQFNENLNLEIENNEFPDSLKEVQLFGNGLAETKDVDYSVAFDKQIEGFNSEDTLLYDLLTGSSVTVPFLTGYINTGSYLNETFIEITGVSGIDTFGSGETSLIPFNWDIYLNGQKLIESINYSIFPHSHGEDYYENHIALFRSSSDINNFNNLNDPSEFKLVPLQKNPIKKLYLISGDSFYLSGLNGFSEQVWKNGVRQKREIDYFKENICRSQVDHYYDPNYYFKLADSQDLFFNNFIDDKLTLAEYASKNINSIIANYDTKTLPIRANSNQMFLTLDIKRKNITKSDWELNKNFILSDFYNQLFALNFAAWDVFFGDIARDENGDVDSDNTRGLRLNKNCVLISPRHVLMRRSLAKPFQPDYTLNFEIATGTDIHFLNPNNPENVITRSLVDKIDSSIFYTPIGTERIYDRLEITVGLLNESISEIEPFYVLPSGYRKYLVENTGDSTIYANLPCMTLDSLKCLYTLSTHSFNKNKIQFTFPNNETQKFNNLLKYLQFQDAGCPFFTILKDKLVLLSISNSKDIGNEGINIAENIDFINNKIKELNIRNNISNHDPYYLKQIDLDYNLFSPKRSENPNYLQDHIRDNIYSFLEYIDEDKALAQGFPYYIYSGGFISNKRSEACWLYPLSNELSCLSPSNNYPDPSNPSGNHGTLITPRHVAFAYHAAIPLPKDGYSDGSPLPPELQYELDFIAADNTVHKRKIIARKGAPFNSIIDFCVALLDRDLPPGITGVNPCYFLPDNFRDYMQRTVNTEFPGQLFNEAYSSEIYCVHGGRFKELFVLKINDYYFNFGNTSNEHKVLYRFSRPLLGGDSGGPIFLIINGKLVLIGVMHTADPGWHFFDKNFIQKEINSINSKNGVNSDYKVKTIDLTNFHKFGNEDIFKKINQLNYIFGRNANFKFLNDFNITQFYTGKYKAYYSCDPEENRSAYFNFDSNYDFDQNKYLSYEGYYDFEPRPDLDGADNIPGYGVNFFNRIDKPNNNKFLELAPNTNNNLGVNVRVSGQSGYGVTLTGNLDIDPIYITDSPVDDFVFPPGIPIGSKYDFNEKDYGVSFWFYYDSSKPVEQNLFHWGTFSQNTGIAIALTGIGSEVYPLIEYKNNNNYFSGKTNNSIIKNEWNYLNLVAGGNSVYLKLNNFEHEKIISSQTSLRFSGILNENHEFTIGKKVKNGNIISSNCTFDDLYITYNPNFKSLINVFENKINSNYNLKISPIDAENFYVPSKNDLGINLNGKYYLTDNFPGNTGFDFQNKINYYISFNFYYDSSKSVEQNLFYWGDSGQQVGFSVALTGVGGQVYPLVEFKNNNQYYSGRSINPILKNEWNNIKYIVDEGNFLLKLNNINSNEIIKPIYDNLYFQNLNNYEFTVGKKIKNGNIIYSNIYIDELEIGFFPKNILNNKVSSYSVNNIVYKGANLKNSQTDSILYTSGKYNYGIDLNGQYCLTDNFTLNEVQNTKINLNDERFYGISFWFYYDSSKPVEQNLFHWGASNQAYGLSVGLIEKNGEVYVEVDTKSPVYGSLKSNFPFPIKKNQWNFLSYYFIYDLNAVFLNGETRFFIGVEYVDVKPDTLVFLTDQLTDINPHEFTIGKKIKNGNIIYSNCIFDEILFHTSEALSSNTLLNNSIYLLDKPLFDVAKDAGFIVSRNFNVN